MKCMRSLKLSTMTTFNSIMSLAVRCVMTTAVAFFFLREFACNFSKVAVTSLFQLVICVLLEIVSVK